MKYRGVYNEDGSIKEWPEFDVTGGRYEKPASTKRLKDPNNPNARATQFVVLPPRFDDHARIFTILQDTERRDAELQAQLQADYERTNADAIAREAEAQRDILGSVPSVSASSFPVIVEPEPEVKLTRRGTVTDVSKDA